MPRYVFAGMEYVSVYVDAKDEDEAWQKVDGVSWDVDWERSGEIEAVDLIEVIDEPVDETAEGESDAAMARES
jgi:hypothetical protein